MKFIISYLVREREFLSCKLNEAVLAEEEPSVIEGITENIIKIGAMISIAQA